MKKCAVLFLAVGSFLAASRAAELEVTLLETNVLRVQVNQLTEHFAEQLRAATPTNAVIGSILDLRAANGDPGAAPAATEYFALRKVPLVILVDGQTSSGAVALAKNLRAAGAGLIIGSTNDRVQPDIAVAVRASEESFFLKNPYATPAPIPAVALSATNSFMPYVDHTSEADLVRRRVKDGEDTNDASSTPRQEPGQPVIRDPVLARAVDLLKALAILHPARG